MAVWKVKIIIGAQESSRSVDLLEHMVEAVDAVLAADKVTNSLGVLDLLRHCDLLVIVVEKVK